MAKLHYMGDSNLGPRGGKMLCFHCPGCAYSHPFEIECPDGKGWTWNGSMDKPTFSPSLLVYGSEHSPRCHSFVKDGMIRFLGDCTHALAGQMVEIPDWDVDKDW